MRLKPGATARALGDNLMTSQATRIFAEQTVKKSKRERTRIALLESAVAVLAEKGFDGAKINDVTTHAGLANGTFYNYYKDKDELIRDVGLQLALEVSGRIDEEMAGITNAIERVTIATARVLLTARREPEWLGVLLDGVLVVPELRDNATRFLRQDLQMGVDQGLFTVPVDAFLVRQILALVKVGLQFGPGVQDQAVTRTCVGILLLLGLSQKQAARHVTKLLAAHQLLERAP